MERFLPFGATLAGVVALLWLAHVLLIARHRDLGSERLFPRQLLLLGLTVAGLVAVALMLPVQDNLRGALVGLIGLFISGLFGFSSTTIVANLMSGIMLRVTRPFHTGDFITVQGHFGRVVERGLLDTEIQTERRELVSLPNTYLISNPVSVVRSSGAIVSAAVSLGYDVHHRAAETALLAAARACGLQDAFVRITALGDFSVSYRASGVLADTKTLLTARSDLNRHVLDALHGAGIEIVSPNFMNQRPLPDGRRVIPAAPGVIAQAEAAAPAEEDIVFDKAADAARASAIEARNELQEEIAKLETSLADAADADRAALRQRLTEARGELDALPRD